MRNFTIFHFIFSMVCSVVRLQFVVSNDTISNGSAGKVTKEVCLTHDIAELERYLKELDITPEVHVSNITTYNDNYLLGSAVVDPYHRTMKEKSKVSKSDAVNDIESLPFGELPVDWKRLRLLFDLILPEDEELNSKLFIVYNILIAANRRANDKKDRKNPGEAHDVRISSTTSSGSGVLNGSKSSGDVGIDAGVGETETEKEKEESMVILKPREKDIDDFEKTKMQSSLQMTTSTARVNERIERSTYDNENYGLTSGSLNRKYENENITDHSQSTETWTNEYFNDFSEPPPENNRGYLNDTNFQESNATANVDPDTKISIPQIEELENNFKDNFTEELNFLYKLKTGEKATLNVENARNTEEIIETGSKNDDSVKDSEDRDGNDNDNNNDRENVTDFENVTVSSADTIKEMRSDRGRDPLQVTAEEIKPDLRNDQDFETTVTPIFDSVRFPSPSSLSMDEKTASNFEKDSMKNTHRIETSTLKNKNAEYESSGGSSLVKNQKQESSFENLTRKTLIIKIGESFSNKPKPVEVISTKNIHIGSHISKVNNFADDERDSRINSLLLEDDDNYRDDSRDDVKFGIDSYGKDKNLYNRTDQELSVGINYFPNKVSPGFGYFRRNRRPPASTSRKQEKRSGLNTNVEKLYRWFYRGGEKPEEANPSLVTAEIKCEHGN